MNRIIPFLVCFIASSCIAQNIYFGNFNGDGSQVTNLNAGNVASGVLPIANGGLGANYTNNQNIATKLAVLDMNLQTGLTQQSAANAATASFTGQIGFANAGIGAGTAYYVARSTTTGDWMPLFSVNDAAAFSFGDPFGNFGSSTKVLPPQQPKWNLTPSTNMLGKGWSNADAVIFIASFNPYTSGAGGINAGVLVGTNLSFTNYDDSVLAGTTNNFIGYDTNGHAIFEYDSQPFSVLTVPANYQAFDGNGMASLVSDPGIPLQVSQNNTDSGFQPQFLVSGNLEKTLFEWVKNGPSNPTNWKQAQYTVIIDQGAANALIVSNVIDVTTNIKIGYGNASQSGGGGTAIITNVGGVYYIDPVQLSPIGAISVCNIVANSFSAKGISTITGPTGAVTGGTIGLALSVGNTTGLSLDNGNNLNFIYNNQSAFRDGGGSVEYYVPILSKAANNTIGDSTSGENFKGVFVGPSSTAGFTTYNTNQFTIQATGITNSQLFNIVAYATGTAVSVTYSDGTNTIGTYTISSVTPFILHPSYKITAAAGLSGVAIAQ